MQQIAPGVSTAIENHAEIAAENFRTENLILINETIKHLETEINQLENDLAGVKLDIQNCIIKAPIDGNINIITEINRGDNIVAGTTIATIIPEDDDNSYVIQIYASNEDISKVNIGDKVKYSFLALPYKEYGELTGKITKIATDTKITKDGSSSYYLVEADIQTEPLISYKGEESKIKIGMECEARVVTRTKKIIHYLLEKIDLRL